MTLLIKNYFILRYFSVYFSTLYIILFVNPIYIHVCIIADLVFLKDLVLNFLQKEKFKSLSAALIVYIFFFLLITSYIVSIKFYNIFL